MAGDERRYRDKPSHPIPVWNGLLEHRTRIDGAIWVYLWLLDAITIDKDGVGLIHGGAPVKVGTIAHTLEFDDWTIRQHLKKLADAGYINRRRTPYGYVIHVLNSQKFGIWHRHKRSGESPRPETQRSGVFEPEIEGKPPERSSENPRNKEDAAKNAAKDAAVSAAATDSAPSAFTGTHLVVSQRQDHLLAEAFPGIDRQTQYRKADAWLEANPERHPRNAARFLQNWFSKIPAPSQQGGQSRAEQIERRNLATAGFGS